MNIVHNKRTDRYDKTGSRGISNLNTESYVNAVQLGTFSFFVSEKNLRH